MPFPKGFKRLPKNNSQRTPAIQAWRTIGGKRHFFRSKQEANYARWLEFQKQRGIITEWEHEPETFWFDQIKRGINNYTPDYRVTFPDGKIEYHEVKGWMDSRSKTKIKRFQKYHPTRVLKVYDSKWYRSASKKLHKMIPGWE
jgi:hypothetical protein